MEEYKRFYIGRYEISKSEDGAGKAQSKKGKEPWANIKWGNSMTDLSGGIVSVARSLYPNREDMRKGQVVSTLIYGVAWDETVRFLKTKEEYKNIDKDSTGFGNNGVSNTIKTGSNETYCLNNIYDFVGNVREWTMEVYNAKSYDTSIGRINRSGGYGYSGVTYPVSIRDNYINSNYSSDGIGGRVQLYIK